jgi:urease accessory protein
MKTRRLCSFIARLAGSVFLLSSAAFGHPMKGVGDFYAGMLHPLTSIEMVLPLIAFSLLAGQQSREAAIRLLAAFPATIVLGTLLIHFRPVPSWLGAVELIMTAGFGILVAWASRLPNWLPIAAGGLLGLAMGWTNAAEITPEVSPVRFVAGLAAVGLLMIIYGIGLVRRLNLPWMQIAVRVVGSWIAAVGILVVSLKEKV